MRVDLVLLGLLFVITVGLHLEGLRYKVTERMENFGVCSLIGVDVVYSLSNSTSLLKKNFTLNVLTL